MIKAYRLFIFVVLSATLLLSACASAQNATTSSTTNKDVYGYAAEGGNLNQPALAPSVNRAQDEVATGSKPGSQERMVITNASLSVVVEDPAASMDLVSNMATEMGGYVVTSSLYLTFSSQGDEVPEATITIRVPSERLTEAMNRIKALVKDAKLDIRNEQVSGQDVTQEYTDMGSRLRNLEATETQLLEIQSAATTTEEIMMVFNQITSIREQIEVLKGQMQYYEEASSLSSLSVTLIAHVVVEPVTVAGWQPEGIARDALQALVDAGKWLVEQLIWLVLYVLPIVLVIGIPAFFILRAVRRQARKSAAARPQPQYPPYPPAGAPPAQPQG